MSISYVAIKQIHISCAVISITGFGLRDVQRGLLGADRDNAQSDSIPVIRRSVFFIGASTVVDDPANARLASYRRRG